MQPRVPPSMDTRDSDTYIPLDMESSSIKASKGRPREFCVEQALAAALGVFWTKGYEGSSMSDLTQAMGITRPSLYAAFGNKEELFRKALDLYEREKLAYVSEALAAPTSREVVECLLKGGLETLTGECEPRGCLRVIGSMTCGLEAGSVRDDLHARRASSHAAILARMALAKSEGDLPAHTDVEGITNYLLAIFQGMSVQANNGASREQLEEVVRTTLAIWPGR